MGSLYSNLICKHDENVGSDGWKIKKSLTFSIVPLLINFTLCIGDILWMGHFLVSHRSIQNDVMNVHRRLPNILQHPPILDHVIDIHKTFEKKFNQKCFAETHIWLAYPRNTTLHNPDHTLLSFGKKTFPMAVYPHWINDNQRGWISFGPFLHISLHRSSVESKNPCNFVNVSSCITTKRKAFIHLWQKCSLSHRHSRLRGCPIIP